MVYVYIYGMYNIYNNTGPIIMVIYMVEQVNCVRNKEGEIIEVSKLV